MARYRSWAKRLEYAEKRGYFTEYERDRADSWMTCAIGEKSGWKGWDGIGAEAEAINKLTDAGVKFMYAVHDDDIPAAKRLYEEIMAL